MVQLGNENTHWNGFCVVCLVYHGQGAWSSNYPPRSERRHPVDRMSQYKRLLRVKREQMMLCKKISFFYRSDIRYFHFSSGY